MADVCQHQPSSQHSVEIAPCFACSEDVKEGLHPPDSDTAGVDATEPSQPHKKKKGSKDK